MIPLTCRWWRGCIVLVVLPLMACGTTPASTGADSRPSPSVWDGMTEHCMVNVHTVAWRDANANGVQDAGEAPLAGVTMVVYDQPSEPSGAEGWMFDAFYGPCDPTGEFVEVRADPPPGFAATTPQTVTIELQSGPSSSAPRAAFGFQPTP